MDSLQKYRDAFTKLPEGCREAELNAVFTDETSVTFERGELTGSTAYEKNALYIRATGEKTGTVYTESMEDEPERLILAALENASGVDAESVKRMADGRSERVGECATAPVSTDVLMEFAKAASLHAGVMLATASVTVRKSRVLNSNGLDTELVNPLYTLELDVLGKGEDNYRSISESRASLDGIDVGAMLARIAKEEEASHEELPYIKLPSGEYDAVISNAMTVNIMNTAWQLFAEKLMKSGRSIFKQGEEVGSAAFSVTDAATTPLTGYDFSLDAEGVRGVNVNTLVKAGVIVNTMRTLQDGDSTGNAGYDDLLSGVTRTDTIPIPRNIYINGGEETPEALVRKLDTGIHITYSIDEFHSTNVAAGTFSIPCGGVYYENGVAKGRVQQMNMYGSFKALFHAVEAAANDVAMKPMGPYNSYCFGGPSLLVRGINIAI